jgi:hypothetical protein
MENSKIEWTDHTFNPWIGCHHVSPGLRSLLRRNAKCLPEVERWYLGAARAAGADLGAKLEKPGQMECRSAFKREHGYRPRVFCASLGRAPNPEGIEGAKATAEESTGRVVCGWWMRQNLGGHFGPEYNVARNWLNVGRPLPGLRPGAGIKEHHVFQVVQVIGPDQVRSGNDHNAVRTRIRSTAGVIGWLDVTDETIATDSATLKQQDEVQATIRLRRPDRRTVNLLATTGWRGKLRVQNPFNLSRG